MQTKNYDDLSQVPLDKLYKLRDVAHDNLIELIKETRLADERLQEIIGEIQKQHNKGG